VEQDAEQPGSEARLGVPRRSTSRGDFRDHLLAPLAQLFFEELAGHEIWYRPELESPRERGDAVVSYARRAIRRFGPAGRAKRLERAQ
jgi:hypothetical protein